LNPFEESRPYQIAFALAEDSEFSTFFNHHLLRMMQDGSLQALFRAWFKKRSPDDASGRIFAAETEPAGLESTFTLVMIFLVGLFSSAGFACYERLYFKKR